MLWLPVMAPVEELGPFRQGSQDGPLGVVGAPEPLLARQSRTVEETVDAVGIGAAPKGQQAAQGEIRLGLARISASPVPLPKAPEILPIPSTAGPFKDLFVADPLRAGPHENLIPLITLVHERCRPRLGAGAD